MRIKRYLLSLAAAVGMIAACDKPEMVQISAPENIVPPVLESLEAINITPTNMAKDSATFAWSPADYGASTQVSYSIEAAKESDASKKVTIVSGLTDTTKVGTLNHTKVSYDVLNQILFNDLELSNGIPENVLFYVASKVGVTAKVYSDSVKVSCTVTAAEKVYPKIWVIGDYCGWNHANTQFLFDFDGNDAVYQGVVDFGEKAANGWKITGVAGWDDTCNWGGEDGVTYDEEAATTQFINGGGSKDIKHYSKRFYHFAFDKGSLLLTKNAGFDQIGVIGSFNDWATDVVMEFNASKQKFYADVEVPADGEFKFRLDGKWDVSYGVEKGVLTTSGGNIAILKGNYRVYLNMNNYAQISYELNADMFGKDEPVSGTVTPEEPEQPTEPEQLVGWGLVGEFSGWADGKDMMLASDGTYLVAKGVELSGQFKFRKDGKWDTNLGATGEVEPFELTANSEVELVANGKNFTIAAGTYDVYLDEANAKAWFITDGSYPGGGDAPEASEWGVVGVVNSWGASADVVMYKTAVEGLFVAYNVAMPDGGFKIRANNKWDDTANYGLATAGAVEVDHAYDLVCSGGSGDMTLVAGNYDIWFDLTNSKVYIMTPGKPISEAEGGDVVAPEQPAPEDLTWYLVGQFNGWTVGDAAYTMTKETEWYVFKGFVSDGAGFKFNAGSWDINRGATGDVEPFELTANTEYEIVANGKNFSIAAGTYDVYMNLETTAVYVMAEGLTPGQTSTPEEPEQPEFEAQASEWGIVGVVNGWNAPDVTMYTTPTEGLFVAYNVEMPDGGFKIRANGEWNDAANYGLATAGAVEVDHVYDLVCSGGSGDMTLVAGTYDIWFDLTNKKVYIMTPGKAITEAEGGSAAAPEQTQDWYLVGNFNGWTPADANYKMTFDGEWYVFENFTADGQGVKFVADSSWSVNRGGAFAAAGEAISVAQNGDNMIVAAGTYDVYLNKDASTAYFMTPGATPAN